VDLHPPTVVGSTINQGPAKAAWDRYKRKLYHTSGVVFGFFLFFFCSAFYGVQAVPHTTGVFGFFFCFFFACFSALFGMGPLQAKAVPHLWCCLLNFFCLLFFF